jgi:protein CpxP
MKKIMLALFLIIGIAAFAKAQDTTKVKKTPQERAAQMTKMMQKKLNLTADQTTKISAILTERATQMDEPKMKGVKGGRVVKMQAMADADKKINAVLTADQQKQYADMEAKTKEKMASRKKAKMQETTPVTPPVPAP